ncbi:MAG: hypothetical protein JNG85_17125 [Spirochaetaceae bacterium]|nr:hypothetical protein [Spirochaetaceae bacterium]
MQETKPVESRERALALRDGYYEGLVERGQLFALRAAGSLLGIGELRRSATHAGYGDMGVHVVERFRGRGSGFSSSRSSRKPAGGKGSSPWRPAT